MESYIVRTAGEIPTIVATVSADRKKQKALKEKGVRVISCKEKDGHVDLQDLMLYLGNEKIDSILLEGGKTLNGSALRSGIVDRVEVYVAPKIFGGTGKYTAVGGIGAEEPSDAYMLTAPAVEKIGDDFLLSYDVLGQKNRLRKS